MSDTGSPAGRLCWEMGHELLLLSVGDCRQAFGVICQDSRHFSILCSDKMPRCWTEAMSGNQSFLMLLLPSILSHNGEKNKMMLR